MEFQPFLFEVIERLDRIEREQQVLRHLLVMSLRKEVKLTMTLDEVLEGVQKEATVEASLVALTTSIKAQLDQSLSGALTPEQQAKVDAIFDQVQTNITTVTNAVTANTPAAPAQ